MAETSTVMKVLGGVAIVLAVGVPIFGMGQYVSDLRHDMEQSRTEVENLKGQVAQLQDILQKTQVALSSSSGAGIPGPKGDAGPMGPQGPQGERGPQGLPGESARGDVGTINAEQLKELVDRAVAKALSSVEVPSAEPGRAEAVSGLVNGFDLSDCIDVAVTNSSKGVLVRQGSEFCETDGRLVMSVGSIQLPTKRVRLDFPGNGETSILKGTKEPLKFNPKRLAYIERMDEQNGERTAILRFE